MRRGAQTDWVPYSAGEAAMPPRQQKFVLALRGGLLRPAGWQYIEWQPLGSPMVYRF